MLDADTGGWLVANRTSDNEAVLRLQSKHRARLAVLVPSPATLFLSR